MPASECVQYKLDTVLSIFLGIITNIIISICKGMRRSIRVSLIRSIRRRKKVYVSVVA